MFEDQYGDEGSPQMAAVNCVSPIGCPLAAGECSKAGECYLFRCAHPLAPKPTTNDELLAHFAELVLTVTAARRTA
jgi:hypothetical protein